MTNRARATVWATVALVMAACGGSSGADDDDSGGGGSAGAGGAAGTPTRAGGSGGQGGSTGGGSSVAGSSSSGDGTSAGTSGAGTGGSSGGAGSGGQGTQSTLSGPVSSDRTLSGAIALTSAVTVDAGVTLTLAAGAKVTVASGGSLSVAGTLSAVGTAADTISFAASDHAPGTWAGLVVTGGGSVTLTHVTFADAGIALTADKGSSYALDYVEVSGSTAIARLSSAGTIAHSKFHSLGTKQQQTPVQIQGASPHITNSLFDQSSPAIDTIVVGAPTSAPVFDHLEITQCHCAFHFNDGTGVTIENSNIHGAAYGLMVEQSLGTTITGNNFEKNSVEIGSCNGGSVDVSNNYFDKAAFDGSCGSQTSNAAATSPISGVGPVF